MSERDPACRKVIAHNFMINETAIVHDCTKRSLAATPHADLYTGGFPCQPFAGQGLQEGALDAHGRGVIGVSCVQFVAKTLPKVVLLENVKGILFQRHRPFFKKILSALRAIRMDGQPCYDVYCKLLDTRDHGIPQSRPRLYVLCLRRDCVRKTGLKFHWPPKVPTPPLSNFLIQHKVKETADQPSSTAALANTVAAYEVLKKRGADPNHPYVANVYGSRRRGPHIMDGCVPCLTRTRAGTGGHFLLHLGRMTTSVEMQRLQGIPDGRLRRPAHVSERQLLQMIGNAFSLNVLTRVLARALPVAGLSGPLQDVHSAVSQPNRKWQPAKTPICQPANHRTPPPANRTRQATTRPPTHQPHSLPSHQTTQSDNPLHQPANPPTRHTAKPTNSTNRHPATPTCQASNPTTRQTTIKCVSADCLEHKYAGNYPNTLTRAQKDTNRTIFLKIRPSFVQRPSRPYTTHMRM